MGCRAQGPKKAILRTHIFTWALEVVTRNIIICYVFIVRPQAVPQAIAIKSISDVTKRNIVRVLITPVRAVIAFFLESKTQLKFAHHRKPGIDIQCSDSLRRHIRRDHEDPERSTTRATRACTKCRMTKARCQGGSPCTQCQSDGSLCIFDNVAQQASGSAHQDPKHIGSQDPYLANDPVETSFANTARIQHHIQLYFAHFHPNWPILHRQTFSVPDEPPFLLQAVLMIGLWVNGSPQAQQAARDLHSKLGNEILAQRVS